MASSNHVRIAQMGNKRKLIIDNCNLSDDAKFAYVVGEETSECEVYVKDLPVSILKGFEDTQIIVGDDMIMYAKLSLENAKFKIYHDGNEVVSTKGKFFNENFFIKTKKSKDDYSLTNEIRECQKVLYPNGY